MDDEMQGLYKKECFELVDRMMRNVAGRLRWFCNRFRSSPECGKRG